MFKLTEKHDDVRDAERDGVDDRPGELLERRCTEDHKLWPAGGLDYQGVPFRLVLSLQVRSLRGQVVLELAQDRGVVLLANPAQELETHDQEGHADTGRGKCSFGPDVPARGQET